MNYELGMGSGEQGRKLAYLMTLNTAISVTDGSASKVSI
jgi:hypothetical protein